MTDLATQDVSSKRLRTYLRIEATLFIAGMIGAFTLSGYAYLEKYYRTMDIAIERLGIGAQEILAYGATRFGSYIGALAFGMALVGIVAFLLLLLEKTREMPGESQPLPKWITHVLKRTIENRGVAVCVGLICLIAVLLIFAWYFLVRLPSNDGRFAALKQASECVERRVVYANLDQYDGCQVAESEDMLYLIQLQKCDKSGVAFRTLQLPKQGLKSITTETLFYPYKRPDDPGCSEN